MEQVLRNKDLLQQIFKFLDEYHDRFRVLLTCKLWHMIGEELFDPGTRQNLSVSICLIRKLYIALEYLLDQGIEHYFWHGRRMYGYLFPELVAKKNGYLAHKVLEHPTSQRYLKIIDTSCLGGINSSFRCTSNRIEDSIFCGPCLFVQKDWWLSNGMGSDSEKKYWKKYRCRYVGKGLRCNNHIQNKAKKLCQDHLANKVKKDRRYFNK